MNVLILSPFFYPEPISTGKYNTELALALAMRGEKVTILASHPFYPKWHPQRSEVQLRDVTIVRGGALLRYPRSAALRRALLELWYAWFARRQVVRLPQRPDIVVAVFPPNLFLPIIHPLLDANTVVTGIVHDIQSVHAVRSSSRLGRLAESAVAWLERRAFARCTKLIFLSRTMADHAVNRMGVDPQKCVVRYPFSTTDSATPTGAANSTLAAQLRPEHVNVVYAGALGEKQCPEEMFRFMIDVSRRDERIRCHIFSDGPHFERLRVLAENENLTGIEFRNLVPEEHLNELYARSSVHLLPQAPGTAAGSLPSKLPNLIAAGVPIFAICDSDSEIRRIIQESQSGTAVNGFASAELHTRFQEMVDKLPLERRRDRIARLRPFVDANFNIERTIEVVLSANNHRRANKPA